MFEALETAFQDAIIKNEIPDIHATFAAHSYIALLKVGNYRNPDQTGIFPNIEETAENIITFFWNGLFSNQR